MRTNARIRAYCNIYGVNEEDCKIPEHKARIDEALDYVWQYAGQLPGESVADADIRRDLSEPGSGAVSTLAAHLTAKTNLEFPKNPPPTAWEKIFITFKRMNDEVAEKPVGSQTTVPIAEDSSSDITQLRENNKQGGHESMSQNNGNVSTQEETKMEDKTYRSTMSEALNQLGNEQDKPMDQTNVGDDIDSTRIEATKEAVNARKQSLIDAFVNGRIVTLYVAKPALKEILEKGVEATGVIVKPEETLKTFIEKTGMVESTDEAGNTTVAFPNVPAGSLKDARTMYDYLTAAVANPDGQTPIKVNVPKDPPIGAFKGYSYTLTSGGDVKTVTQKELLKVLQEQVPGRLTCVGDEAQARLSVVSKKDSDASSGKTSKRKAKDVGTLSVKIVNRKALKDNAQAIKFLKEVDAGKALDENAPIVKSDLSIKYKTKAKGSDETVERTYRLPLRASQFKLNIVDEALYDMLMPKSAAGSAIIPMGSDDTDAMNKVFQEFMETTAVAVGNKDNKSEIIDAIKASEKVKTEAAAQTEAEAAGL